MEPKASSGRQPIAPRRDPLLPLLAGAILLAGGAGALFVWKLRGARTPAPSAPAPRVTPAPAPPTAPPVASAPAPAPAAPPAPKPVAAPAPAPIATGGAELRVRKAPERPGPAVPWSFPPRAEWITSWGKLVLRGRSSGPVSVTPASGPPLAAAPGPDGRFALDLRLAVGRNPFAVKLGDDPEVELVVERVPPIDDKEFKAEYLQVRTSSGRIALIRRLNLATEQGRELVCDFVLKNLEAYYREAAIELIASLPFEELGWISERVEKQGDPVIVEGILEALGLAADPRAVPLVAGQLSAKKDVVLDAAVRALGRIGAPECAKLLAPASVAEVASNAHPRVVRTLDASRAALGLPAPPAAAEESLEAFAGGVRLAVRIRGREPQGTGLTLFVFPPLGLSADVMIPYLAAIEAERRVIYVELPGRRALPRDLSRYGPFYPFEGVLEAFEQLHGALASTRRIQDKPFALLSCGVGGWISMIYTAKHPKKVRRQVLVAVPSGGKSWREGLARVAKKGKETGDLEMEQLVGSAGDQWFPDADPVMARKAFFLQFADVRDQEILRLLGPLEGERWWIQRPIGDFRIPDFSLFKLDRSPTPTLIMTGAMSTLSSIDDCEAIAKHYQPTGKVVSYRTTDRAPWVEREEEFTKDLRKFLGAEPR